MLRITRQFFMGLIILSVILALACLRQNDDSDMEELKKTACFSASSSTEGCDMALEESDLVTPAECCSQFNKCCIK